MRFAWKLIRFIFINFCFCIICSSIHIFIRNLERRRRWLAIASQKLSKILLQLSNIKVHIRGQENIKPDKNYLVVMNHTSYIDIPVVQSLLKNTCFITHYEMRTRNFFLYALSILNECLLIERRSLKNLRKEIKSATEILKKNFHLIFFPEGKSTNGEKVIPFHPPFFISAIQAKKEVLPICLNYISIDDEPVNKSNKDTLCWYRESNVGFIEHVLGFSKIRCLKLQVDILPPISSENKKARELALESHKAISEKFKPLI